MAGSFRVQSLPLRAPDTTYGVTAPSSDPVPDSAARIRDLGFDRLRSIHALVPFGPKEGMGN